MKIYDVIGIGANLTGSFSGSFKGLFTGPLDGVSATSSYVEYTNVANKPALVSGSSQISYSGITNKPSGIVSGSSQVTYSGLSGIPNGIVSGSSQVLGFNVFATTGSNQFNGNQSITGSLTVTGQVIAQTLNVQQVTSSVVFSSGSNVFGNSLGNTQQFTGSVSITGSLNTSITAFGSAATTFLTSDSGTIRSRTAAQTLSDIAALPLAGGTLTGPLTGSSASFNNRLNVTKVDDLSIIVVNYDVNNRMEMSANGLNLVGGNPFYIKQAGGSNQFTITTGGNVGIGTATPDRNLEVETGSDTYLRVTGNRGNADGLHVGNLEFYNSNTTRLVGEVRGITGTGGTQSNSGQLAFYTNDNGTYAERMRITSGGDVGIGRTPNWKLDVNGIINSETAGNSLGITDTFYVSRFVSTVNSYGTVLGYNNTLLRGYLSSSGGNSSLGFITNSGGTNFERMTITSGGNVLIGTTSDNGAKLQVSGDATLSGVLNINSSYIRGKTVTGTANGTDVIFFIFLGFPGAISGTVEVFAAAGIIGGGNLSTRVLTFNFSGANNAGGGGASSNVNSSVLGTQASADTNFTNITSLSASITSATNSAFNISISNTITGAQITAPTYYIQVTYGLHANASIS